eukprot:gene2313-2852_t
MYSSGPSGFQNAPVTKLLMMIVIGSTLMVNVVISRRNGVKDNTNNNTNTNTNTFSILNLLQGYFIFSTLPEMVFGSILMYGFRMFERMMGSSKFTVFLLSSITFSTLIHLILYVVSVPFSVAATSASTVLRTTPFAMAFTMLVLYYRDVPPTSWFRLFRIPMNDKILAYLLVIQTVFSFRSSILSSCLAGLLSGILYSYNFMGVTNRRLPRFLIKLASTWIEPLLQSPNPPNNSVRPILERQQQRRNFMATTNGNGNLGNINLNNNNNFNNNSYSSGGISHRQLPLVQPSEENIQLLESMGFPRDRSIEALQRSGNSVNDALQFLIH